MSDESVASDVSGGANESSLSKRGADAVDLRHQGDDLFLERARSHSAFNGGGGDTGA